MFKNEIIWKRGIPKGHAFTRFASSHDSIFFYSKGDVSRWNADASFKSYDLNELDEKTDEKYQARSQLQFPHSASLVKRWGVSK
jgi:hypothetical protein